MVISWLRQRTYQRHGIEPGWLSTSTLLVVPVSLVVRVRRTTCFPARCRVMRVQCLPSAAETSGPLRAPITASCYLGLRTLPVAPRDTASPAGASRIGLLRTIRACCGSTPDITVISTYVLLHACVPVAVVDVTLADPSSTRLS